MATITVRGLDDEVWANLKVRAAQHGRSMEAEVRAILHDALAQPSPGPLGARIVQRFATIGGADLELPDRREPARPANLK